MKLRVYNYNTLERVEEFEAHSDYIRSVAVHPTNTFVLTSSGERQRARVLLETPVGAVEWRAPPLPPTRWPPTAAARCMSAAASAGTRIRRRGRRCRQSRSSAGHVAFSS